jgi:parallel beta-helix repeat protein
MRVASLEWPILRRRAACARRRTEKGLFVRNHRELHPVSVRIARCALAIVALAIWLTSALQAGAAQYFVDVGNANRSDSGPGSAALPWATLQHAANVVGPGDRVTVLPGSYTGFNLVKSGMPATPIEFIAQPGVLINQRNATTPDGINLEGASHVVIDGFTVNGMPRAGVRSVLGNFVTVRHVRADKNTTWGIFTGFDNDLTIENNETSGSIEEHGIYVSNSGDRPTLRGNVSWGNHGSGIHMNGDRFQGGDGIISGALITGNVIFDNAKPVNNGPVGGGSGINMDGVQNSRIENNLVYGNHASGISLYKIDGAAGSSGNVVVNNTIQQPPAIGQPSVASRWAINIRDESTNNTVRNNILLNEGTYRGAISVWDDSLPGFASDYNVVVSRFTTDDGDSVQTLAQWQAATGNDAHSKVGAAAALFVNPATGDYRLKAGAAAINAGTSVGAPAFDLLGAPRPQGATFDAGAYEFAGLAGDFDGNGSVNGADLGAWKAAFIAGTKTGADFLTWQRQLAAGGGAASAPEPTGAVIVMAAVVSLAVSCRRAGLRTPPQ